jgi:predicted GIY-YIG superfamily endonuclease
VSQTSLYRHFAADGSLLYVGISLSWPDRTKTHAQRSKWFEQVAKVEIERFTSRQAALDAEREAIKRERPQFNIVHNCRKDAPPKRVAGETRRVVDRVSADPVLRAIVGPHAIVGPALVYRDDTISMMVAHGEFGTDGDLIEVVLGELSPDTPEWTQTCPVVLVLRRPNEITMSQAQDIRLDLLKKLRGRLREVQAFDTDLALAVAYASQFPSEKSRQVLNGVAIERGVST